MHDRLDCILLQVPMTDPSFYSKVDQIFPAESQCVGAFMCALALEPTSSTHERWSAIQDQAFIRIDHNHVGNHCPLLRRYC
jgi:hypothetical protein